VVVFELFPALARRLLPGLPGPSKAELFDVVGVFFPIVSHKEMLGSHLQCLSAIPDFADELARLVTLKLKNSLQDTRPVLFSSLPLLLVHRTASEDMREVVLAFVQALKAHFAEDSTCEEAVVEAAVGAIEQFVRMNGDSWTVMRSTAVQSWVPEIAESRDPPLIRALSIMVWHLDRFLGFAAEVLPRLAIAAETDDQVRIQSVLASVVEYLKLQTGLVETDLTGFFAVVLNALPLDNRNLQISCLVLLRELALHSVVPVCDTLIPLLIGCIRIDPFFGQVIAALGGQTGYQELIESQILLPFTQSLIQGQPCDFGTPDEMSRIASVLVTSPTFTLPILMSAAKSGNFRDLKTSILHLPELDDDIALALLNSLPQTSPRDLRLAIAVRTADGLVTSLLREGHVFANELIASASPAALPTDLDLGKLDADGLFWIATKLRHLPAGFHADPVALAIRGVFTDEFTVDMIPRLLDFENAFDGSLSTVCDKFDFIQERFVYDPDYKIQLWETWNGQLNDNPAVLLKLCLLCPPEFFLSQVARMIGFLPKFIQCDVKGTLDLLIFCLVSLDHSTLGSFLRVTNDLLKVLLVAIDGENARTRLDVCRVLHLMALNLPRAALGAHKSRVMRKLRGVLDDPKREVRKEAGLARCEWYRLDEVGAPA
jgi:hypothetical protein